MTRFKSAGLAASALLLASGCNKPCDSRQSGGLASGRIVAAENVPKKILPEYFGSGKSRCSGQRLADFGFRGALDEYVAIEYFGKIRASTITYYIYDYDRNENHGLHAILLMNENCVYFGSYFLYARPMRISGNNIVFDAPKNIGNVIHFSGISPPARLVIDGEPTQIVQ